MIDFASGTVMDIVANGRKLWSITERLDIPGQASEVEPFGKFYELDVASMSYDEHTGRIFIDGDPVQRGTSP